MLRKATKLHVYVQWGIPIKWHHFLEIRAYCSYYVTCNCTQKILPTLHKQKQPNQHQNQTREGDPKFYTKGNIASYTNSAGEHIVALISTNPYDSVQLGPWQIATVHVHLRRKCFMKAIGNVIRERTNVLCIEYNKFCAVYLWNIQLHNDESHHLHVPHFNSHSLVLEQRRALLHICGSTRPAVARVWHLTACNIDKQLCETFVIYSGISYFK